jgi:predicted nucleic acid-binding protein
MQGAGARAGRERRLGTRLYLDTSVLGALVDRDEGHRIALTRALLENVAAGVHVGVVSNVVNEELEQASREVLETIRKGLHHVELEALLEDEESRNLFAEYVSATIVPVRYRNDLRHVAVATVARVDALVSWNFRHLVNLRTRRAVHAVNVGLGYPMIEIVSPEEV